MTVNLNDKKKVVVFYGFKGSGKDTCYDILKDVSKDRVWHFSFAEELRKTCWQLFKTKIVEQTRLWGAIDKKEEPIKGWVIPQDVRENCGFAEEEWTGRRLLQWFGTEVCRNIYDTIWIDRMIEQLEEKNCCYDVAVVTDCRFKNEYEALKNLNPKEYEVTFVQVDRGNADNAFSGHASEQDMLDFEYDIQIENKGSLKELKDKVKTLEI